MLSMGFARPMQEGARATIQAVAAVGAVVEAEEPGKHPESVGLPEARECLGRIVIYQAIAD